MKKATLSKLKLNFQREMSKYCIRIWLNNNINRLSIKKPRILGRKSGKSENANRFFNTVLFQMDLGKFK